MNSNIGRRTFITLFAVGLAGSTIAAKPTHPEPKVRNLERRVEKLEDAMYSYNGIDLRQPGRKG